MTENEVLEILNQTNIKTFEERLEKKELDKDNNEDLLLETDEILENLDEQTSQISGQDNYNWELEDYLNSDDN
ncbi:9287_t:CDS:2 [Cetraspora pellucida]|uniref:9287_t:CDS:1 n=1 Tax=Cetraspora pellucida TaxID=1433469 RepID=A0ACA9M5D6_9GLOM|nr:9287_t:CDS:2 [Cetraspora pellucida]